MQSHVSPLLLKSVAIVALMMMLLTPTLSVAAQEGCDPKLTIEAPVEGADAQGQLNVWGYALRLSIRPTPRIGNGTRMPFLGMK